MAALIRSHLTPSSTEGPVTALKPTLFLIATPLNALQAAHTPHLHKLIFSQLLTVRGSTVQFPASCSVWLLIYLQMLKCRDLQNVPGLGQKVHQSIICLQSKTTWDLEIFHRWCLLWANQCFFALSICTLSEHFAPVFSLSKSDLYYRDTCIHMSLV